MIFPSPPHTKPLLTQTIDRKKSILRFAFISIAHMGFIFLCIFFAVLFHHGSHGQKAMLDMVVFAAKIAGFFIYVHFILVIRVLIKPYRFGIYEEGLNIKGLGFCPWRLVMNCDHHEIVGYGPGDIWWINLSCAENPVLSGIKKPAGAERVFFLKEENVIQITYADHLVLSNKMKFRDFNTLIKACIQAAKRNNDRLKVGSRTDEGFELIG